ncbi:uncharacterized protein LOC103722425 [Phoenix dactylifera]|uniref:Uncharacterized protein LOC103722425 n=1 Tax=Phoenix dactylifera TaxID=42345 RepID=A0A8B7D238_PHODC|nr:uncharacterized protein LOC103722425 [Phoenix dactylifera]
MMILIVDRIPARLQNLITSPGNQRSRDSMRRLLSINKTSLSVMLVVVCIRLNTVDDSDACFKCSQQGHKIAECLQQDFQSVQRPQATRTQQVQGSPASVQSVQPSSPKQQTGGRPHTRGHIYALTQQDAQASNTVASGTLPVASVYDHILFDSGATHFFVSSTFARKHDLSCVPLEYDLHISTPAGSGMIIKQICNTCPIQIVNRDLTADLIVINMHDFDIILGIDWSA